MTRSSTKSNSNKEMSDDRNSIVFWLEKIYEKIENIDINLCENNKIIKENSERLETMAKEIKLIKEQRDRDSAGNMTREDNPKLTNGNLDSKMNQLLDKRKLAYYNSIRNEGVAAVYKKFIEQTPPFIPRKFRESINPNASQKQRERMKNLEKQKLKYEIERLDEAAEKHRGELDDAELDTKQFIGDQEDALLRQDLKEKWCASVKREEARSNEIWNKKQQFLEDLPTRDTFNANSDSRRPQWKNGGRRMWDYQMREGRPNIGEEDHHRPRYNGNNKNFSLPHHLRRNR